jgi:hypothetical protein
MSQLWWKKAFALPGSGRLLVESTYSTEAADPSECEALDGHRDNGRGCGWRRNDEQQKKRLPLCIIVGNRHGVIGCVRHAPYARANTKKPLSPET